MREGQLLWWLSETGEGGAERGFVRLREVVWVRGMLSLLSWEGGEAKRVFLFHCLLQHGSVERIRTIGGTWVRGLTFDLLGHL